MSSSNKKQGYDRRDIFGDVHHYDSRGRETGVSRKTLIGDYVNYDSKGNRVGTSRKDIIGEGFTHYDAHGNKTGRTTPSAISGFNHYDSHGNKTGTSSGVPLLDHYSRNGSDLSPTNIGYREPAYRDINRPEWTKSITEVADDQFYGTDLSRRPETYGTGSISGKNDETKTKQKLTGMHWFWFILMILAFIEFLIENWA